MARCLEFKTGGGWLNNTDGSIARYRFTEEAPFDNPKDNLFLEVALQEDGREEAIVQSLLFAFKGNFKVSKDGQSVTPIDGVRVPGGTQASIFLESLKEAGHPGYATDDDDVIDLTPMVGTRVRFTQVPLTEDEIARRKKAGVTIVRKDKTDPKKTYPLTNLGVSKFYSVGSAKASAKAGTNGSSAKGTAASSKVDIEALSVDAVIAVLNAAGKPLEVNRVVTKAGLNVMQRDEPEASHAEAVKEYVTENYAALEGVVYSKKTKMLSLDE